VYTGAHLFGFLLAHAAGPASAPDPDWKTIRDTSEADGKIVEKVESTFMDPVDFSPLK